MRPRDEGGAISVARQSGGMYPPSAAPIAVCETQSTQNVGAAAEPTPAATISASVKRMAGRRP